MFVNVTLGNTAVTVVLVIWVYGMILRPLAKLSMRTGVGYVVFVVVFAVWVEIRLFLYEVFGPRKANKRPTV
jgi:hypothetical protein